jgi:hypothetical protein
VPADDHVDEGHLEISLSSVNTDGFADGTATLVIGVAESDMIDVTSGVTTAAFTVTGCLNDDGDGFRLRKESCYGMAPGRNVHRELHLRHRLPVCR